MCGVLAVVNGDGMRALFEGMGARVLDGGATLNPSTYELLAGIHEVPAEEVVVLPNSPNVRMAAERAAELSEKVVRVVPTLERQELLHLRGCAFRQPFQRVALGDVPMGVDESGHERPALGIDPEVDGWAHQQ